jgi:hypothetical protein
MTIIDFHVQHVLKAYSQQLSVRSRISKDKSDRAIVQKDEVTLSQESKKMLIIDKIASGIVTQLSDGSPRSDTAREILNRLSQEYGRPLDVGTDDGNGLSFKVISDSGEGVVEYLPTSENEKLKRRVFDIAQSVIYKNLFR